jgi:hypothetical protein
LKNVTVTGDLFRLCCLPTAAALRPDDGASGNNPAFRHAHGKSLSVPFRFGLKPYDPLTLVAAVLLLALIAAAASLLPRRASKLDPVLALRDE